MSTRIKKSLFPEMLNQQQKEILTGLLLGDAYLNRNFASQANTHLTIGRSFKDHNFNLWLSEIFYNMLTPKSITDRYQFDKRTNKFYHKSDFRTKTCYVLNEYHSLWYINGKKHIPQNLILSPLTIAIWLCDDGSVIARENGRLNIKFATNGFSEEETIFLSNLLSNRYQESFIAQKTNKKDQYVISAADAATRTLLKEKDSFFPASMLRKTIWRESEIKFFDNSPVQFTSYTKLRKERLIPFINEVILNNTFTIPQICNKLNWYRIIPTRKKQIPSFIKLNYLKKLIDLNLIKYLGLDIDNKTKIWSKNESNIDKLLIIRESGKF